MEQADGYVTTDMAFATVLIMNGYNPFMRKKRKEGRDQVYWVIGSDDWDEHIEHLEQEYLAGACLVDPRRFMRESRDVRQRMYTFLGIGDKPRGARIRRSPSADA